MFFFFSNTIDALAYLEQNGIAHRDIKPDNTGNSRVKCNI